MFSVKKLIKVCTKLLMFNYKCNESQGESVKVSQNRAALFGMTLALLMLLYMAQSSVFESSKVLSHHNPCLFSIWAKSEMTEPGQGS